MNEEQKKNLESMNIVDKIANKRAPKKETNNKPKNKGKKATLYKVVLPDGNVETKRSYNVNTEIAWAGCYFKNGTRHISGISTKEQIETYYINQTPVKAKKVS